MKIEKIDVYERKNMKIGKISSNAEYGMDELNVTVFRTKFWFPKLKFCKNLLIFKIV